MNKKPYLILLFFLVFQPLFSQNVLIIYSDDQSYNTINAWGNKEISTPNLDRLVHEGFSFRQAHVMGGHHGAVCMPSRVMMLTGRYLNRLPQDGEVIPDSIIGLPEVLRKRGYTTFHSGKWHSDYLSHDRFFSTGENLFFGGMHFEKDGGQQHPFVYHYNGQGNYPKKDGWKSDTYSSELYTNAVLDFLQSNEAKEKPFLCYLALTSPHDPRTPPRKFKEMYSPENVSLPPNFLPEHPFDNGDLRVRDEMLLPHPRTPEAVKEQIALYYGMISELDFQVGRVLDLLEKTGLRENTLVVFAGDNGLAVGQHGLLGKQSLYEHSIRVPLIFSGPGIPKGKESNSFAYLSDITPTIYEWLKITPPVTVEAKSLMPIFMKPRFEVRKNIYNIYGHWSRSLKTADGYKLIAYNVRGNSNYQLFNLRKDPWEIYNLAELSKHKRRIKKMKTILKIEMEKAHDDLNIELPNWGRKLGQKGFAS